MNKFAILQELEKEISGEAVPLSEICSYAENIDNISSEKWSLDNELLNFEGNSWTIRNACEGVICFGATGSGKSSGPLRKMALSFLENDFGGIVFCVKPVYGKITQRKQTGKRILFFCLKSILIFSAMNVGGPERVQEKWKILSTFSWRLPLSEKINVQQL